MEEREHPDVTAAQATGWPAGAQAENRDRPEYRRAFALEEFEDFLDFALDGDPELLDHFVAHYAGRYRDWLN